MREVVQKSHICHQFYGFHIKPINVGGMFLTSKMEKLNTPTAYNAAFGRTHEHNMNTTQRNMCEHAHNKQKQFKIFRQLTEVQHQRS